MHIHVVHGPNLNMLGKRDPDQYGTDTLEDLTSYISGLDESVDCSFFQSNSEEKLINYIHKLADSNDADGLIINLGAFTHTSVALRDALEILTIPKVEVHLSNIHARESFRHTSYSGGVCAGIISGFGFQGYDFALQAIKSMTT